MLQHKIITFPRRAATAGLSVMCRVASNHRFRGYTQQADNVETTDTPADIVQRIKASTLAIPRALCVISTHSVPRGPE